MTVVISGGLVSVEDGTKKSEEYSPPRKVRVELRFDAEEGGSLTPEHMESIGNRASAEVARLLGATTTVASASSPARPARAPRKSAETVDTVVAEIAKAGKQDAQSSPVPEAAQPAVAPPTTATTQPSKPARDYSDRELKAAMSAKHQEIQDAVAIRSLVREFRPEGWTSEFTSDNIPQEHRKTFLAKLEAMKKQ